ncbi:MAG: hypothetical protein Q9218_003973 [Villophora microphyllina]
MDPNPPAPIPQRTVDPVRYAYLVRALGIRKTCFAWTDVNATQEFSEAIMSLAVKLKKWIEELDDIGRFMDSNSKKGTD